MSLLSRLSLLLVAISLAGSMAAGCSTAEEPEVIVEDLRVGTGPEARPGDSVAVHYTGWLEDGTVFDTSRDRAQPWRFWLGMGTVIDGWEQGLPGMREGGKRRLTIPPELAYGRRGICATNGECLVPRNATLVFEIDLVEVIPTRLSPEAR